MNIISCDSTTFRRGKRGLSPFEAELACVHWALRKEDYFCRGARKIIVCSDAKSLGGFINQDLEKIKSDRKQQMVEEMLPYRLEVRHVPGLQMELADHGSRYPISHGQHRWIEAQPGEIGIMVRSNRVQSTDIKDPKVEILAGIAARDNVYQNNVDHIENQDSLNVIHKASELKKLASDWHRLSVVSLDSGKLILRDNEILIPKEARAELSGLVCPKLCGGVIVSAMAGRMPGHFHSFSEDWAPSKPVRDSYLQFANIHSEDHPTSLTEHFSENYNLHSLTISSEKQKT